MHSNSYSVKSHELITQMPDFTEPTVGNVMKVFQMQKTFGHYGELNPVSKPQEMKQVFSTQEM